MSPMHRWCQFLGWFDLLGADGKPSFSKNMTVAVLLIALVTNGFTLGIAILCVAAAFGRSTLLAFINRSNVQVTDQRIAQVAIEAVRAEPNVWKNAEN